MESNRASPSIALPLLTLSSFFFALAVSDPRITEAGLYCNYSTEIVTRNVSSNLEEVLTEISESVTYQSWGNYSLTSPPPAMYGLAQCHGDLNWTDCRRCFAESRTRIPRCLPNFGRLYLDGCFLRYDGYDFYNETVDPTHDMLNCGSNSTVPVLVWGGALFWDRVDRVLRNVSASALQDGGFAVAWEYGDEGVAGVYALAQCWSTLDAGGCRVCLENAASKARNCTPGGEARAMNAGCFLRYSITKFYDVPESEDSDPRITEAGFYCNNSPEIVTRNVLPNFKAVMREISESVADQRRGNYSVTLPPPGVYGLAQCHGNLIETDCRRCFAESRTWIARCLPNFGRLYLDGCFLRYDGYDFYNETVDPTHDMLNCGSNSTVPVLVWTVAEFRDRLDLVLRNVLARALQNGGFAVAGEDGVGGVAGVYALAQCWSTLDAGGCRVCLENATSMARSCAPGEEARAMNAGCFLRYSTTKFYNVPVSGVSYEVRITIAIASSAAAISLVLIGAYIGYKNYSKKKQVQNGLMQLRASMSKFRLYFNYETLEKATNFFDDSRKLGQGGGGFVYKGILPNGKVIAVKRLMFNTCQWADDFFNEVNLISGIQHKNLVRLLGCSIEGPESLLVYEYLPNRSLDQVLLVDNATRILTWEERLHIIIGTAEGLAYLHGGCGVKIIHRDIKASNILLDENLTAKISDFGLARCIALDKSHLSTGIAGTIGYMAPEYLVRGQLTEKADVYAFGVLVLEILTSRKNSVYTRGSSSVLQSVWKHYKSTNLAACIDPALQGKFPVLEASNVLQIGLMCTQASMELRPPMSGVVEMLHDKDRVVPQPNQPPFLNASVLFDKSSSRSSTYTHGC